MKDRSDERIEDRVDERVELPPLEDKSKPPERIRSNSSSEVQAASGGAGELPVGWRRGWEEEAEDEGDGASWEEEAEEEAVAEEAAEILLRRWRSSSNTSSTTMSDSTFRPATSRLRDEEIASKETSVKVEIDLDVVVADVIMGIADVVFMEDIVVDVGVGVGIVVVVTSRRRRSFLATRRWTTSSAGSVRRKLTTFLKSQSDNECELIARS